MDKGDCMTGVDLLALLSKWIGPVRLLDKICTLVIPIYFLNRFDTSTYNKIIRIHQVHDLGISLCPMIMLATHIFIVLNFGLVAVGGFFVCTSIIQRGLRLLFWQLDWRTFNFDYRPQLYPLITRTFIRFALYSVSLSMYAKLLFGSSEVYATLHEHWASWVTVYPLEGLVGFFLLFHIVP